MDQNDYIKPGHRSPRQVVLDPAALEDDVFEFEDQEIGSDPGSPNGRAPANDDDPDFEELELQENGFAYYRPDPTDIPPQKISKLSACCVHLYKFIGLIQLLLGLALLLFAFLKHFLIVTPSAVDFACAFFVLIPGILVIASRSRGDKCLAFGAFMLSFLGLAMLACGVVVNVMVLHYAKMDVEKALDGVPEFGYYTTSASSSEGVAVVGLSFIGTSAACGLACVQMLVTARVLQTPFTSD